MPISVFLTKINEDDEAVQYKVETTLIGEEFINGKGKRDAHTYQVYAYCSFNKINENFSIDYEKSDNYFLNSSLNELMYVRVKLTTISRLDGIFKDTIHIATG